MYEGASHMMDRQDRVHELCVQISSENDPERLLSAMTEANDILGSILREVDQAMFLVAQRLGRSSA